MFNCFQCVYSHNAGLALKADGTADTFCTLFLVSFAAVPGRVTVASWFSDSCAVVVRVA